MRNHFGVGRLAQAAALGALADQSYMKRTCQRIADARISYSGKGEMARASQAGWFTRLFNLLNPF